MNAHPDRARPRLVFISHEATRTGAPMVLLRLVRWLQTTDAYDIKLIVIRPGDLLSEFQDAAPTHLLETFPGTVLRLTQNVCRGIEARGEIRGATRLRQLADKLRASHMRYRVPSMAHVSLLYANSAESASIFGLLPRQRPPIVSHIHELGFSLDNLLPMGARDHMLRDSAHFVVCAGAVQEELSRRGVAAADMTRCPELIEADRVPAPETVLAARRDLGIPADAFVVGGSGTRDWRKGVDLFVQLAANLRASVPDIALHLVWVGGSAPDAVNAQLAYDAEQLGVDDIVHFVPPTKTPEAYYAGLDVLALTSREDPYPLVCIEAGLHRVPVVTFESGGAAEYAAAGAGEVVPYADVAAMAHMIVQLVKDRPRLETMGVRAREVALTHDVTQLGPQLVGVIEAIRRR